MGSLAWEKKMSSLQGALRARLSALIIEAVGSIEAVGAVGVTRVVEAVRAVRAVRAVSVLGCL